MWKPALAAFLVVVLSNPVSADIIYLQFVSTSTITGDIDGSSFSHNSWDIELAVSDEVVDSEVSNDIGFFANAIQSGHINLNGTVYEMAASNFALTTVQMNDGAQVGDDVNFITGVLDGGWVEFVGPNGSLFPSTFGDNNDLSSSTGVISASNSSANDWGYAGNIRFNQITTVGGEIIRIDDTNLVGGTTTVRGTSDSFYVQPVPEPTGSVALILIGVLTCSRRRRLS